MTPLAQKRQERGLKSHLSLSQSEAPTLKPGTIMKTCEAVNLAASKSGLLTPWRRRKS